MGKRDSGKFERVPNDLYRTWDERAVRPLLPLLEPGTRYIEPCAGHGDLIDQLELAGHRCLGAYDIEPRRADIKPGDATRLRWPDPRGAIWITNPPWDRELLHPIIRNLARQAPLWALFQSDWFFTDQASAFNPMLWKIVAIGRVRWIPGSSMDGFENCAWYLFDATRPRPGPIEAVPRIY
jgi:hypothetical protein